MSLVYSTCVLCMHTIGHVERNRQLFCIFVRKKGEKHCCAEMSALRPTHAFQWRTRRAVRLCLTNVKLHEASKVKSISIIFELCVCVCVMFGCLENCNRDRSTDVWLICSRLYDGILISVSRRTSRDAMSMVCVKMAGKDANEWRFSNISTPFVTILHDAHHAHFGHAR